MNFLSAQIGDLRSGKLSHPFAIGLLNSELCFVIAHLPPSHRRCNLNPALRTAFQLSLLRAARVVTIVALVLRQIGSKSNTRFVCTNTVCELYEYDDRTSLLKSKSKRCCIHCRAAGLGEFHLRQTGSQANSQYHCLNPNCTLLTGKRAAGKEVGPDVEQVGLGNEMRDVDD